MMLAFELVVMETDCPRCGVKKGEKCRLPNGKMALTTHSDRVMQYAMSKINRRQNECHN